MFQWLTNLFQRKPKCTCVGHHMGKIRDHACVIHGDQAEIEAGRCPDCHGTGWYFGPNGGVGTIIACEDCGAQFLVEVLDDGNPAKVIYWGRTLCSHFLKEGQ